MHLIASVPSEMGNGCCVVNCLMSLSQVYIDIWTATHAHTQTLKVKGLSSNRLLSEHRHGAAR